MAIVGENGVGKTTLFKALVGQLPIDHGKIRFGSHVEMAYYDQEHESLNYNKTIFDEISDCYPRMTNQEIRSTLAMFNFRGDDVFKDIAMLSGGERGRVVLTEVLLKQANFLILDEPTNHLDISSKEVLEEALKSFEGTILFISHDRYFINKIATRVIEVQKDQCLSYNGNYDDYLAQKTPVVETTQKVVTEARQRQIIDKKTKNEIKKLERTIDSLEKEINSLKEELTSEEVMNNYKKYNEITDSIDEKEMELMEIMEKCCEAIELIVEFGAKGSKLAISDAGVGAAFCKAALQGASLNVYINTKSMADREYAEELNRKADAMLEKYTKIADDTFNSVLGRLK